VPVFDLMAKISLDTDEYERNLKKAGTSLSNFGSKIGSGLKKIGSATVTAVKGIATGVAASSAAIGTLATAATKAYADYEQLVGGVETLFKGSSDAVMGYAENAYKTSGMSANEYMETVTSFSASLIQSLGGDTEKAAKYADIAITDMSDNANKMGSDISAIQSAYQGFAKQNYTMLDNLKLGYGGTKEEMKRLLDDATKLSGVEYDISSYADIVEAIHVVQTEMGITGTTAKEASQTISGSIATAKSAWQNLITGLGDDNADLDVLINNLFDSVETVGENIIPRIGVILTSIVSAVEKMAPKLAEELPALFQTTFPVLLDGAKALLSSLSSVLPSLVESILPPLVDGIKTVFVEIVALAPDIFRLLIDMLPSLISALQDVFFGVIDALPSLLETVLSSLPDLLPQIISAITMMAAYLMENFGKILQPIIDNLPDILISINDSLMENLPVLIKGIISLTVALTKATPQIIMALIKSLPSILSGILKGLWDSLPEFLSGIGEIVGSVFSSTWEFLGEFFEPLGEFFANIWGAITEAFGSFGSWVYEHIIQPVAEFFAPIGQFFSNLWSSIVSSFHTVIDPWVEIIKRAAAMVKENIIDPIKNFFVNLWNNIVGVFEGASSWFNENVIEPVKNVFTGAWNALKDGAQKAWEGVKEPFKAVADWFKDIFSKAWQKVKDVFSTGGKVFDGIKEGIVKAFKVVVNAIIKGINKVISIPFNAINDILQELHDITILKVQPFGWIDTFDVPQIPELAKGGIVSSPTLAMIGEYMGAQTNPEVIAPLSELKEMLGVQKAPVVNININNPVVRSDNDIDDIIDKVSEVMSDTILRSGMAYAR